MPPHCIDQVAAAPSCQFFAEIADENIDYPGFWAVEAGVEMFQKALLRDNPALAQHQQFKDREFLAGDGERMAADAHLAAAHVDCERADPKDRLGEAVAAAHDGFDAGEQLVLVIRLGQDIVRAYAQRVGAEFAGAAIGYHQDRRGAAFGADAAQRVSAFAIGEHAVKHHGIIVVGLQKGQRILSGAHVIDHAAARFEQGGGGFGFGHVALDEKDSHDGDPVDCLCRGREI